jgi:predicted DsbA family dithiol-disulfide isomerase
MAKKLSVEVWSDIACPWCYVGKRRFEAALAQFPHRDSVDLTWRSFELDPAAPPRRDTSQSYADRLAKKYGSTVAQAQERLQHMTDVAAAEGLKFDFERVRSGNTFNAHRLLHLARERGLQPQLKERLLRGYFSEGEAIGDQDSLLRMGAEIGLDVDEARAVLSSDTYAAEVRADEREAHQLGVDGVPFFKLGDRYGVPGAQPATLLAQALKRTWDEIPEPLERIQAEASAEGPVCGPDGCS